MVTTFKASHRHAHTTARKARLVADLIRGMAVNRALLVLDRSPQRAAFFMGKLVRSAVANAEQDSQVDPNQLRVVEARVDEGPLLGGFLRWRPGPRGRAMPIRKRTSHIHVALAASATAAPAIEAPSAPSGRAKGGKAAAGKAGAAKAAGKAPARTPAKKGASGKTTKKKKDG